MPNYQQLREIESQLLWCREWYLLRLWQDCGSFDSASDFDRFQIAQEVLAESNDRTKEWALLGRGKLVDLLIEKLDDPDAMIRQEAFVSIGDHCPKNHHAIEVLIERLRSTDQTPHERACSAWALGKIGARPGEVVPILSAVIEETKDQADFDELRNRSAEAIENLTGEMDVLMKVAKHCVADRDWQCRMRGLFLVERLLKRQPELRDGLVPLLEPLVEDEVEEIRAQALRMLIGFDEDV